MQTMSASGVDTYINNVEEYKRSTIGNQAKDEHGKDPGTITSNFKVLRKCLSKRDCLIFEMLFSLLNIFYCFYNLKVSFITYAVILLHPYSNLLATGLHSARAEAKKITFFEFTWEVEEVHFTLSQGVIIVINLNSYSILSSHIPWIPEGIHQSFVRGGSASKSNPAPF